MPILCLAFLAMFDIWLLKLPSLLADFVTELLWHKTTKRDGELSFLPLYFCYHLIFSLPDTADSIREQWAMLSIADIKLK